MKINNNKIINTFVTAACILLLSFVTGCSGLSESTSAQNNKEIELKGRIALAENKAGNYKSRTATSSFNFEGTAFEIYAYKASAVNGEFDTSVKYEPKDYVSGTSFTLSLPEQAEYWIIVKAKKDNKVFAEGSVYQIIEKDNTEPVVIQLSIVYEGAGPGSVKLPVFVDSSAAAKVKKLEVIWEADRSKDAVYEFDSAGKALIEVESMDALLHPVRLNFTDEAGNVLYSCCESINVYPGVETDTWYGTAPYLEDGVFTVTDSMITAYGGQILPSTKTILFDYSFNDNGTDDFTEDDEYSYDYYLVDDVTGSLPATAFTTQTVQYDSYLKNFTFFDKDGNLYHMKPDLRYSGGTLDSNKAGWQFPTLEDLYIESPYTRGFKVDLFTNIAYSIYGTEGSVEIHQYPNLISSNGESADNETMYPYDSFSVEISVFDVYNNKIYLLSQTGSYNTYNLYIFNVKQNPSGPVLEECGMYQVDPHSALHLDSDAFLKGYITDVIYQDDYLYMLYSESPDPYSPISYSGHWESIDDLNVRSRGAVLRYNLVTGTIEALGYTDYKITPESDYKLIALSNDGDILYDYNDPSQLFTVTEAGRAKYPNVYFPGQPEKEFYGPRKFLAVKPKKLIFSDEGLTFYTDDDNFLRYKNVNRIVYVDLEDFSIQEVVSPANGVSMTKNINYSLKTGIFEEVNYSIGGVASTGNSCYYLHIINDDAQD